MALAMPAKRKRNAEYKATTAAVSIKVRGKATALAIESKKRQPGDEPGDAIQDTLGDRRAGARRPIATAQLPMGAVVVVVPLYKARSSRSLRNRRYHSIQRLAGKR